MKVFMVLPICLVCLLGNSSEWVLITFENLVSGLLIVVINLIFLPIMMALLFKLYLDIVDSHYFSKSKNQHKVKTTVHISTNTFCRQAQTLK